MSRTKLVKLFRNYAPKLVVAGANKAVAMIRSPASGMKTFQPQRGHEFIDHYANTSLFAIETLSKLGDLRKMKMLSLGCHMANLADYIALFEHVYHCTTLDTSLPVDCAASPITLLEGDFFDTPEIEVDCFISQASIHCLSDTRYRNVVPEETWARPYQVAQKLDTISGGRPLAVIVSIAVGYEEAFIDNNAHLSHDSFVESFLQSGFCLESHFFDHLSHAIDHKDVYLQPSYRRSTSLPPRRELASPWSFVIGNYFFLKGQTSGTNQ